MRAKDTEGGYSLIEIILTFVLFSIVASVGWFVIKSNNAANKSFENAKNALEVVIKNNKEKSTIPKDWKTYTSKQSAVSFSYPSTWTEKVAPLTNQPAYFLETVTLEGPNAFTLQFLLEKTHVEVSKACSMRYQHATTKLNNGFYSLSEGVNTKESDAIYLRKLNSADANGCSVLLNANQLTADSGYKFYGSYAKNPSKPTADFLAQAEVDIAKQIFSTFKEK